MVTPQQRFIAKLLAYFGDSSISFLKDKLSKKEGYDLDNVVSDLTHLEIHGYVWRSGRNEKALYGSNKQWSEI
jgi:hypothetical protein